MADWVRLGEAVKSRRVQLGLHRQQDLASLTGLTRRVLSDIEHGRRGNYDKETLLRLEQALEWAPGSVRAVLDGGQPLSAAEAGLASLSVDLRSLERYGDDTGLMGLVAGSGLPPGDALRLVLRIRQRRAEQYGELVEDVRRWVVEMGGRLPDGDGGRGGLPDG